MTSRRKRDTLIITMNTKSNKRKVGRPARPAEEKQSARVAVSLTVTQMRELAADAKKAGMSRSAYLTSLWERHRRA